jgi:alkylated DNA repair dioxygenase AlkB
MGNISPPTSYYSSFIDEPDVCLERLWNELAWVQHFQVPRREYYCPNISIPYTYGQGRGVRTYTPQPSHEIIDQIRIKIEEFTGTLFDVCFLNGYADQSDQLGWHSDNSPEMDDDRPIAIISLGAEREIWFAPIGDKTDVTKLKLQNGSLCLMEKGMQDTHLHRIPKANFKCGKRVSLTFRGFTKELK